MIYRGEIPGLGKISAVSFGGASLSGEGGGYGFGPMSEAQAEALLKSAWEQGITVYDTAPIYGFGLSEERMGRYLNPHALVISKGGVDWHATKRVNMTNAPEVMERMLNESLKRLKRDAIDLYMIHWPDPKVDVRRPMEVLKNALDDGRIKSIGLCNTNPSDLKLAQEISPITTLQSELNVFHQEAFNTLGEEWKKYVSMSWGTFDKGILSGRVYDGRAFEKDDARSWAPWWNRKLVKEKVSQVKTLELIVREEGLTLSQFALGYNLYHFGMTTALIGFKSAADILEVGTSLHAGDMRERIEEVLIRWNN